MIVEEQKAMDKNCCRDWKQPCCGSLCMAWRWVDEDWSNPEDVKMLEPHTHGYCGLGGRP